jgi:hypothetical protein
MSYREKVISDFICIDLRKEANFAKLNANPMENLPSRSATHSMASWKSIGNSGADSITNIRCALEICLPVES